MEKTIEPTCWHHPGLTDDCASALRTMGSESAAAPQGATARERPTPGGKQKTRTAGEGGLTLHQRRSLECVQREQCQPRRCIFFFLKKNSKQIDALGKRVLSLLGFYAPHNRIKDPEQLLPKQTGDQQVGQSCFPRFVFSWWGIP